MFAMFLWWVALLVILAMLMCAPVPKRLQLFGLFGAVLTVWLLWGMYGVELFADVKWPVERTHAGAGLKQASDVPSIAADLNDDVQAPGKTFTDNTADGPTARLGQVGDLFGGINALFAALAFAGVALAAQQQAKSTKIAQKQSIEATFFSALELHHRIADGLRFDVEKLKTLRAELERLRELAGIPKDAPEPAVNGRLVFNAVLSWIATDRNSGVATYQATIANYGTIQSEANFVIGHYFRNLYQILKLIDEDEALDGADRQKYASMLRAQLSAEELAVLMINCAGTMVDKGQFRQLLIRYRMLEHLPIKKVGREYLLTTTAFKVVLADEPAMKQYLEESFISAKKVKYQGAFGANSSL